MSKIIQDIATGFVMGLTIIYMMKRLTDSVSKKNKIFNIFCLIIFSTLIMLNFYYSNEYTRIIFITIVYVVFYCLIFEKDIRKAIASAFTIQLIILISELIFSLMIFIIFGNDYNVVVDNYFGKNIFIINSITCFFDYLIVKLKVINKFYGFLHKIISYINIKICLIILLFTIITLNFLVASIYYEMNKFLLFGINAIIAIIYFFIALKSLNEKDNYIKISKKYDIVSSNIESLNQVITTMKVNNHENKNQLLTIRNMILKKEKDIVKYIDKIVNNKIADDENLIMKTSAITNSGISSIIYSKLLYMKDNDIKGILSVDRNIIKSNLIDLNEEMVIDICKILGVILDNAIEAVNDMKRKNISISLLMVNKNELCISVTNNYKYILDYEKMKVSGYTTKGNGRGYGLSLVKTIVDNNKDLELETLVDNKIFKQILKIKM